MKLRFTHQAIEDITDIAAFVRDKDPAAASRVRDSILDSINNLIAFPEIGRKQDIPGVRKLITRKYAYIVYYSLEPATDEVIILSVQHPLQMRVYQDL